MCVSKSLSLLIVQTLTLSWGGLINSYIMSRGMYLVSNVMPEGMKLPRLERFKLDTSQIGMIKVFCVNGC